ncbi:MAG: DNA polymerase II, partial [Euryarchaeota archaeon]|nr:DNA polymerase II [Euryarchaeota archaeon]
MISLRQWDVRLLTASYRRGENDQIMVEMYGKTVEGASITARYVGFLPYFHILEPTHDVVQRLKEDLGVVRVEDIELFHRGKTRRAGKVVVKFPWTVPEYRTRLRQQGFEILAADIPFHNRFVYDFDIAACIRIFGDEVESAGYTTDIVVDVEKAEGRPRIEDIPAFNPQLKILAFDVENSIKDSRLLTICYVVRENGETRTGDSIVGSEREMIERFSKIIQEEDPDVLTGYNIDGYDIPTILERGKAVGIQALQWGRDLGEPRPIMNRFWRLTGRLVADAWWAAKVQLKPKQETLNHVARLLLGEEKLDVDPTKIDEEWKADSAKVIRY